MQFFVRNCVTPEYTDDSETGPNKVNASGYIKPDNNSNRNNAIDVMSVNATRKSAVTSQTEIWFCWCLPSVWLYFSLSLNLVSFVYAQIKQTSLRKKGQLVLAIAYMGR